MRAYVKVLASLGMAAIVGTSLPLATAALAPTLDLSSADEVIVGSGGRTDPTGGDGGNDAPGGGEGGDSGTDGTSGGSRDGDKGGPSEQGPPSGANGGATCCTF